MPPAHLPAEVWHDNKSGRRSSIAMEFLSLSLSLFGCHGDSFWVPLPAAVSDIVVSREISPLDLEKRRAAMVR